MQSSMESYPATKRNDTLTQATTWMNPENMLSETSQTPPWSTCPQLDRPSSPEPAKSCGPCRRNPWVHRRGDRSGEDRDDLGHAVRVSPQPYLPGSSCPRKINQQSF